MFAAIKVRGNVSVSGQLVDTMKMLNLTRVNHLSLVSSQQKNMKKMLEKARDYVTYGEINAETLEKLLEKRGMLPGGKKISIEFLKEKKISGFKDLAEKLISEKTSLKELGIKPVFRLRGPRKGYERGGIKKQFNAGGALGYRASEINELALRMV